MKTAFSASRRGRVLLSVLLLALAFVATDSEARSSADLVLMGSDGRELQFEDLEDLLDFLRNAQAVSSKILGQGITKAEKVLIENQGVTAHVVFHDVDEYEQRLKRLPNGRLVFFVRDSFTGQIAAYELGRMLEIDNIPPTVERRIDSSRGSAQLWIENAMTEQDRRERDIEPPDYNVWNQRYADMRVFDNLINNIDRNQGNVLMDSFGNLWMIDHTRAFGRDRSLPRPELVTRCSRGLFSRIRGLDRQEVRDRLSRYLRNSELEALFSRRDKLVTLLEEKIAEKGEEWVLFEFGSLDPGIVVESSAIDPDPENF